jgi:xanthine dehydrogenase YagS FAD-binding subunit
MKNFKLAQPVSVYQAASFLSAAGDKAMVIAGGTDLIGLLKEGLAEPEAVVDLTSIPGLASIKKDKDGLHIGALTTVSALAEDETVKRMFPGLRQAAAAVASPQLRNMGTVGGNLCQRPRCWYFRDRETVCRKKGGSRCFAVQGRNHYHAVIGAGICHIVYPSDLAPSLISLQAKVTLASAGAERTVLLEDFYALPSVDVKRENILQPGEILTDVVLPLPAAGARSSYLKFIERGAWDFAVVSAAAAAVLSGKTAREVRLVMGGVAPVPWRLKPAEEALRGKTLTETGVRQAVGEALKEAQPMTENAYKVDLAKVIAARAVMSLAA